MFCGGVVFDRAGVAFGDESTVEGFEVGDACGQMRSIGSFDFGAELQAQALLTRGPAVSSVPRPATHAYLSNRVCVKALPGNMFRDRRLAHRSASW